VDEVVTFSEDAGVDVVTALVDGTPAEALQAYLSDNGIDLIAMGTRGRSNIERHLLGSVTQQLVRTSPVPVMTVGTAGGSDASVDRTYTDLLLPTRGGDGSELAIDHAISLAARFDATLHVLYVVDIRAQATKHETYELGSLTDKLHTNVTDEAVERATAAGVETRAVIQQGTPYSAIQRYTDDHDIDVIIMGTHGRGPVKQFLLGSITERTVRTADVPVVTVRLDEWFDADAAGGSM
ncbi:MAG: universal stress protein, partial [Halobellus sp.]|uniref:universal stress protein n=1 Tax=Halobellus sp. TaxID=1979212 RepID=UPI0035D4DB96